MKVYEVWFLIVIERSVGMNTDFYPVFTEAAPAVMVIGAYPGAETTPPVTILTGFEASGVFELLLEVAVASLVV